MKTSTDRILTTHVGSLPRPKDLIELLVARDHERQVDLGQLKTRVRDAVADVVAKQVELGIDIVSDGETSKISYTNYVKHRLDGFGAPMPLRLLPQDLVDHPEFIESMRHNGQMPHVAPPACRGPILVKDRTPLQEDLANYRAAVDEAKPVEAFLNAASPGVLAHFMPNDYYPSQAAYVEALAAAQQDEYETIHAAGFILQIDSPDLAMVRHMTYAGQPLEDFRRAALQNVEALNHATRNIPPEAMRLHLCWGNYPGAHTHDVPFRDIADIVFRARPQAIAFEAANPSHGHEWEDFAGLDVPMEKILVPGVIDTNTNQVEHPRLIEQRLCRWADLVGRERIIAGTDCGFSTVASLPRIWPTIAWEKLRALSEGAGLATARLWP